MLHIPSHVSDPAGTMPTELEPLESGSLAASVGSVTNVNQEAVPSPRASVFLRKPGEPVAMRIAESQRKCFLQARDFSRKFAHINSKSTFYQCAAFT